MNPPQPTGRSTHLVDATMFWSPSGGGVRRYLLAKQAWLARQAGWKHTIAVPSGGAPQPGMARLPAIAMPGSGGYRLPLRRGAIADILAALKPDLIEAGDPYTVAWSALDAARRLQVPAVAYCHSNPEMRARLVAGRHLAGAAGRAARGYARRIYGGFDRVFAPSESMRRHLADWGIEHTWYQPLGVDTTRFHPARASATWRERMGYDDTARVLVYAGRFAPEKHLDRIAEAVEMLGAPYTLLAIGAGPTPPRGARVRVLPFIGAVDELATAYASADAFVHAGDQETFGLSVLEAMACATPVVARRAEGLAELVDDSVGIGVPSGSSAAFAEAIDALFASDLEPKRRAARVRAETYDWEQMLPLLLDQYRSLLRGAVVFDKAAATASIRAVPLR